MLMTDKQYETICSRFRGEIDYKKLQELDKNTASKVLDLVINGGWNAKQEAKQILKQYGI